MDVLIRRQLHNLSLEPLTRTLAVRDVSETSSNKLMAASSCANADGAKAIRGFTAIEPRTICFTSQHKYTGDKYVEISPRMKTHA